jgi:CubicO group peptidase (beta-lactamase class C family)
MKLPKEKSLLLIITLFIICTNIRAQQKSSLPHSTPEAEGVSSQGISAFLDATKNCKTEFHSFIFLRHGKVIAEGWWNPYSADLKHTLYSCSKSFTATAVGFAISEHKVALDDKVISFFPKDLPDTVSKYLAELTVKDALMMSDGMDPDPTFKIAMDSNWARAFLSTPILHEPGSTFLYNSLGTYMLSAIVQKVTGEKVIDYLKPRLFVPLGISGIDWETDTKGINTGGWGLRLKTEDMAKFAQLFLQNGRWNGKQVLPEGWVEQATTAKIIQHPDMAKEKRDSSDWEQGYCYQMWRCRNNAYRGDGAFGQYMIVMPDQDAALAITAETSDMQEEINLVWKYLLPAMHSGKLPDDKTSDALLQQKAASLALTLPAKSNSSFADSLNGKTYTLSNNALHLQNISFSFSDNHLSVGLQSANNVDHFDFGNGLWQEGFTTKPGPSLTGAAFELRSMLFPAKIAGTYSWLNDHTLQLKLRYIESPHTETFTCHFDGTSITLDEEKSFDYGSKKIMLKGNKI